MNYSKKLAGTDVSYCLSPVSSHQSGIFWGATGCQQLDSLLGAGYSSNMRVRLRFNKKNLLANLCRHYSEVFYVKDQGTQKWNLNAAWLSSCNCVVENSIVGEDAVFGALINRETTRTYIKGLTSMVPEEGGAALDLRKVLFEGDTLVFEKDASGIIGVTVDLGVKQPIPAIPIPTSKPYSKSDFISEVFVSSDGYDRLVDLLTIKKNLVLQGAPGVGKTFASKRLAWAMLGSTDDSHISFVQFHQSYCYEDFVLGFRPDASGFKLATGTFFHACKQALSLPNEKFFVIIDEINRGNLSRIFGELLMLIENDKRGTVAAHKYSVRLPNADSLADLADRNYANDFFVPENLYIIGMMNTADRSLAMIDYALRRRFSFYEMMPAFDSAGFKGIVPDASTVQPAKYTSLLTQIKALNDTLTKEFGAGFCIGHSYFCRPGLTKSQLENIINFEIYPMLQEYWFDDTTTPKRKYDSWRDNLLGSL